MKISIFKKIILMICLSVLLLSINYCEIMNNRAYAVVGEGVAVSTGVIVILFAIILAAWVIAGVELADRLMNDVGPIYTWDADTYTEIFKWMGGAVWSFDTYLKSNAEAYAVVYSWINYLSDRLGKSVEGFDLGDSMKVLWWTATNQIDIPADVIGTVWDWSAASGWTTSNINNMSTIEYPDMVLSDFTNSYGSGMEMPIYNLDLWPGDLRYAGLKRSFGFSAADYVYPYGAIDIFRYWYDDERNLRTFQEFMVDDTIYGTMEMMRIYLSETLIITLNAGWNTDTGYGLMQFDVFDETDYSYDWIGHDFMHYQSTQYNIMNFDSRVTGGWEITDSVYYTMIAYSAGVNRFFWYIFEVNTRDNIIQYVWRLPLNDAPLSGSEFDNSTAVIGDYTQNLYTGIDIDLSAFDPAMDLNFDDILINSDTGIYTDTATGNLTATDTTTWEEAFANTIVQAIADGFADANVNVDVNTDIQYDPDIPENLKKFRLPNIVITKFPFCLPWDMIALITMLSSERQDDFIVDLSFDFEMSGEQFTMPFVINFDWIDIERIAAISRWVSVMSWVAFLISITRKMTLI